MIEFQNISKVFPSGRQVLSSLSFAVEKGETLVLLGQSGSGKTTALRLINRLIEPTSGHILIEGQDIQKRDPIELRRHIGCAFQHIGLFPHMTVAENIAVVPKLLQWASSKIATRTEELMEMVGLSYEQYKDLYPESLSGGQKQRVGVARALAGNPPIVLMDEPFGALDPHLRTTMQEEFLRIQSKLKKTVVFVTHDLQEAVQIGNRIAILEQGTLKTLIQPEEKEHALHHLRENLPASVY